MVQVWRRAVRVHFLSDAQHSGVISSSVSGSVWCRSGPGSICLDPRSVEPFAFWDHFGSGPLGPAPIFEESSMFWNHFDRFVQPSNFAKCSVFWDHFGRSVRPLFLWIVPRSGIISVALSGPCFCRTFHVLGSFRLRCGFSGPCFCPMLRALRTFRLWCGMARCGPSPNCVECSPLWGHFGFVVVWRSAVQVPIFVDCSAFYNHVGFGALSAVCPDPNLVECFTFCCHFGFDVRRSAVLYGAVRSGEVRRGAVWKGVVWCGAVGLGAV